MLSIIGTVIGLVVIGYVVVSMMPWNKERLQMKAGIEQYLIEIASIDKAQEELNRRRKGAEYLLAQSTKLKK